MCIKTKKVRTKRFRGENQSKKQRMRNRYARGGNVKVYVCMQACASLSFFWCSSFLFVGKLFRFALELDAYKANAAKPTRAARAAPLARTALPVAAELSESLAALAVLSLLDDDGEEDEEVAEAVLELVVELDDSGSAVVRPPFLRPLPSAGEISRPLILPPLVA